MDVEVSRRERNRNFLKISLYWKEKKEKSGQLLNNQPLSSWEVHSFFH